MGNGASVSDRSNRSFSCDSRRNDGGDQYQLFKKQSTSPNGQMKVCENAAALVPVLTQQVNDKGIHPVINAN